MCHALDLGLGQTPNLRKLNVRSRISLSFHLFIILCSALIAMSAGSWGIFQYFRSHHVETMHYSRLLFSLNTVKYGIESELKMGADFSRTSDLSPGTVRLIQRVRSNDRDILSIEIFDITGDILASTDKRGLAAAIPSHLLKTCLGSEVAHDDGDGPHLLCCALRDDQNRIRGGVLLHYHNSDAADPNHLADADWKLPLIALTLALLVGTLAGLRVIRPLETMLQTAQAALEGNAMAQSDILLGPLFEAIQKMAAIDRDLDHIAKEAERIDRPTDN